MQEPIDLARTTTSARDVAPVIEAVVQTGRTETLYRRAGRGAPVMLLTSGNGSGALADALLFGLAERFRVIAPQPGARVRADTFGGVGVPVTAEAWLRHVIDGLGLERPAIVADEAFGVEALGFVLLDPERVDRLAVVCREPAAVALRLAVLEDRLARTGHPLLLLRLDGADEAPPLSREALEALVRFLARTESPPGPR